MPKCGVDDVDPYFIGFKAMQIDPMINIYITK